MRQCRITHMSVGNTFADGCHESLMMSKSQPNGGKLRMAQLGKSPTLQLFRTAPRVILQGLDIQFCSQNTTALPIPPHLCVLVKALRLNEQQGIPTYWQFDLPPGRYTVTQKGNISAQPGLTITISGSR